MKIECEESKRKLLNAWQMLLHLASQCSMWQAHDSPSSPERLIATALPGEGFLSKERGTNVIRELLTAGTIPTKY